MLRRNDNRRKPGFVGGRDQTQCRFCRRGIKYVDYKDTRFAKDDSRDMRDEI